MCPSCGKRIMQVPGKQDSTWSEGKRVTKNMVLYVVLIVGVVIGAIIIHMYLTSLSSRTDIGVLDEIDFSVSNCEVMDHTGRTAVQVFFSSNAGGEIRIADPYNHVLGYTGFSSNDKSKIIDIGDVGQTILLESYSVLAVCQQQIVFQESFTVMPTEINIRFLEVDWLYIQTRFEDMIQLIKIPVTISGDFPVYLTSIDITIDMIKGPYPNPISESDTFIILLSGDSTELVIPVNISGVEHREFHEVTVMLKDSQNAILGEFTQQSFVS